MSFYSEFAQYYEQVFPFRGDVYTFLRGLLPGGRGNQGRILDVGCGTGHYCGRFAADGYSAVGLDLDAAMIAAGSKQYPAVTFHAIDMRELPRLTGQFDLIYCIGNVAAHLPRGDWPDFIDALRDRLVPGGIWAFQVVNWDRILDQGAVTFPPRHIGDAEVYFYREYRDLSDARVQFQTRLASTARTLFAGEVWLYPLCADDAVQLHREGGLELIRHLGTFQGTDFQAGHSPASIFTFRQPRSD